MVMWSNTSLSYCEVLLSNRTSAKIGVVISLSLVSPSPQFSLWSIYLYPVSFGVGKSYFLTNSASAGLVCAGELCGWVGGGGGVELSLSLSLSLSLRNGLK